MVFYVSKLGNDTDGLSWGSAFHSIQKALLAIPDDNGGHRIIVRPDVVSDDKMTLLARDIAKKIEESLDYPGQIKVHLIRENRAVDFAK